MLRGYVPPSGDPSRPLCAYVRMKTWLTSLILCYYDCQETAGPLLDEQFRLGPDVTVS